ncbi:hypothetical protein FRB97_008207 [Tulasnella sp. 331]|nr:hypothetical protein FRB97_008207 [Tulasnella sp. 331]
MSLARQKGPRKDGPPHGPGSPTGQRGRGGGPGGGGGVWRGNNPSIMQNYNPRTPPPPTSPALHAAGLPTNGMPPAGAQNNSTINANDAGSAGKNSNIPHTLPPAHLLGSLLVVTTRSGSRHEGTLIAPEQNVPAISLKDARDLVNPGAPVIPSLLIPIQQLAHWRRPDPAPVPSTNGPKALDSFRTDTDISASTNGHRERELKAWQPEGPTSPNNAGVDHNGVNRDNQTFGGATTQPNGGWDQFAANEKLFGVTTDFNEEIYTTKLDRNSSDYKERERKAQQLANEIQGSFSANPHLREERNNAGDDSGTNEEDKYGAVVRSAGAYVPPGARRSECGSSQLPKPVAASSVVSTPNNVPIVSVNGPDGAVGGVQGLVAKANAATATAAPTASTEASPTQGSQTADDPAVASFRDFVTTEKQKLVQKKQAIAKSEKDKRLADLIKFSNSFKLNKPIPADLVTILAKDEDKQKAILEKSAKDAEDCKARAIGQTYPPTSLPGGDIPKQTGAPVATAAAPKPPAMNRASVIQPIPPFKGGMTASASTKVASPDASKSAQNNSNATPAGAVAAASTSKVSEKEPAGAPNNRPKRIQMMVPKIPPFDPSKRRVANNGAEASGSNGSVGSSAAADGSGIVTPTSPRTAAAAATKLNAGASSFKPNPNASAFKPGSSASSSAAPPVKPAAAAPVPETSAAPNPYFGTRPIKKGTPVHIKDDFNPFKYAKVSEASAVPANWAFTGKRYMAVFPPIPHPPPPQQAHMPANAPPASYDESAQQVPPQSMPTGYPTMMFYNPYQYPGAQPPQPQMMAGPNGVGPPGPYMTGPYMQPMPYPQGMPPNAAPGMYGPPQMNGMPPGQYMPPPPPQGGYQQNGRGSMPPTPIPQHAYAAYHHQSPQMGHQHPLPYQMMMPPTGQGGPPHGYEAQQPQTGGPMGVGH